MPPKVTFDDIAQAHLRIRQIVRETPLLESPYINHLLGGRVFLKAENLQITGSFKLRGAANRLAAMTPEQRRHGTVARSSGNHGIAMAYCAGLMETSVMVVAPENAPRTKIERIRAFGGTVIQAPMHDLAAIADTLAKEEQRIFVSPADDPWVVAGGGTVGKEIAEQAGKLGIKLDDLLVCCSGGGLTAGCSVAMQELSPRTRLYAVEPTGFEKMAKSLAAGKRINNPPGGSTICDALCGPYTAEIPFSLVQNRLSGALAVTDEEVCHAMRVAFSEYGLAVEPGGAAALAAVLSGKHSVKDKIVAVTVTGRNVDRDVAGPILQVMDEAELR